MGDRHNWSVAVFGPAWNVEAIVPYDPITNLGGTLVFDLPSVPRNQGLDRREVELTSSEAVKGTVNIQVRMDNPI